ncbi:MAG: hypothetical protein ACYC2Y_06320 [Armatimonadota bacterium]
MTHQTKAELVKRYARLYAKARKGEKSRILDIVAEITGYTRKHAIFLLNNPTSAKSKVQRKRKSKYGHLLPTLTFVWATANFLCGKRLAPFMRFLVDSLIRHGELNLCDGDYALLLEMSASTIDRLLLPKRREYGIKGRSTTKPGTLLKHQIPIRTFADWDDSSPGFLEVDLVAHCGGNLRGEFINTLDMTDVSTGWTVCRAFMGKGRRFASQAMDSALPDFPFAVLGIDCDNDGIFINEHISCYCAERNITFTRARAYKKNDQCFVEQKNWDVVRKTIGYQRLDTERQLNILNSVYDLLALYQNYFQPSRKLVGKERIGARVKKVYDEAQTPAQRLLARDDLPEETRSRLERAMDRLNPAEIKRQMTKLVKALQDR